jgi:hypothetical protein
MRTAPGFPRRSWTRQDPIIRTYMLRLLIGIVNRTMKNITAKHIEDMDKLADGDYRKEDRSAVRLEAVKTYDMIWVGRTGFSEESPAQQEDAAMSEAEQNEKYRKQFSFDVFPYDASMMTIPSGANIKWFDYDRSDQVHGNPFAADGRLHCSEGRRKENGEILYDGCQNSGGHPAENPGPFGRLACAVDCRIPDGENPGRVG